MEIIQKPFYKDITKRFNEAKQEIEMDAQIGVRDKIIQEKINERTEELENLITEELSKYATTIEGELQTLKQSYAPKPVEYTDPTAELLKRQDFEVKLKTSSDSELQELISNADDLNEWELRTLILIAKDKLPLEGGTLATKLYVKLQNNAGAKWVNDPQYKVLGKALATARMHPKGAISLDMGDGAQFNEIRSMLQTTHRMNRLA